jgi:hypothetical protein
MHTNASNLYLGCSSDDIETAQSFVHLCKNQP